jgi:hypothetical protein
MTTLRSTVIRGGIARSEVCLGSDYAAFSFVGDALVILSIGLACRQAGAARSEGPNGKLSYIHVMNTQICK